MRYCQADDLRADSPGIPPADAAPSAADMRLLDEAVDYAARITKATVSEFLAAPLGDLLEIAVEFFVPPCPPCSAAAFAAELDRALVRRSIGYAAARRDGRSGALRVTVLPPGAFHQWRSAWRIDPMVQHARRWGVDREMLDGILRQARTGWREMFQVG